MKITIRDVDHYCKVTRMMENHFHDGWGYDKNVVGHLLCGNNVSIDVEIIIDDEKEEDGVVLMCVSLL